MTHLGGRNFPANNAKDDETCQEGGTFESAHPVRRDTRAGGLYPVPLDKSSVFSFALGCILIKRYTARSKESRKILEALKSRKTEGGKGAKREKFRVEISIATQTDHSPAYRHGSGTTPAHLGISLRR